MTGRLVTVSFSSFDVPFQKIIKVKLREMLCGLFHAVGQLKEGTELVTSIR